MSQATRHEHGMCTSLYSIHRIAFYETKIFQTFHNDLTRQLIYIDERNTRTKSGNSSFMGSYLDIINIFLAGGEFGIGRNSRRHIACIAHLRFGTGIEQQHIAALDHIAVIMVMQCLSVDCRDNREGELIVVGISHFCHGSSHFAFADSRTDRTHGSQVHVGSDHTSLFDLDDFFRRLIITLVNDTEDERNGRLFGSRYDA